VEGVGHNIPNIDGLDSIIRREPPSPVSELVINRPFMIGICQGQTELSSPVPPKEVR
jgi:hypothetical protein